MSKQRGTFGYPGGKTLIRQWIIDHMPQHTQYIEVFGGGGAILVGKDRSEAEVYNDINSDCVAFFEAVKHHANELAQWVDDTPYSKELFDRYCESYPDWPEDTVEHAGRFLYVQQAMFGGKLIGEETPSYKVGKADNSRPDAFGEKLWHRKPDDIKWLKQRFKKVNIENRDFEDVLNRYDREGAFFYCDPPYMNVGNNYYNTEDAENNDEFDHERFVDTLLNLEHAQWLVSYDHNMPKRLQEYYTVSRSKTASMSSELPEKTETLTMNYDPNQTPMFADRNQSGLSAYQ